MKYFLISLFSILLLQCTAKVAPTVNKINILESTSITEIQEYLKNNPNDKYFTVLTNKLQALQYEELQKNQPKKVSEEEEYNKLMELMNTHKQNKTEVVLQTLMETSKNKKEAVIIVENTSKCNIIFRISGQKNYNLPIPALSKGSILVEKGNYQLQSKLCDAQYLSQKAIKDNVHLILKSM